jgi:hypothetical protein
MRVLLPLRKTSAKEEEDEENGELEEGGVVLAVFVEEEEEEEEHTSHDKLELTGCAPRLEEIKLGNSLSSQCEQSDNPNLQKKNKKASTEEGSESRRVESTINKEAIVTGPAVHSTKTVEVSNNQIEAHPSKQQKRKLPAVSAALSSSKSKRASLKTTGLPQSFSSETQQYSRKRRAATSLEDSSTARLSNIFSGSIDRSYSEDKKPKARDLSKMVNSGAGRLNNNDDDDVDDDVNHWQYHHHAQDDSREEYMDPAEESTEMMVVENDPASARGDNYIAPAGVPHAAAAAAAGMTRQGGRVSKDSRNSGVTSTVATTLNDYAAALKKRGLEIREQEGDGNCLFRAISLQVYGDPAMHGDVRQQCMDFMVRFCVYDGVYCITVVEFLSHRSQHSTRFVG